MGLVNGSWSIYCNFDLKCFILDLDHVKPNLSIVHHFTSMPLVSYVGMEHLYISLQVALVSTLYSVQRWKNNCEMNALILVIYQENNTKFILCLEHVIWISQILM